MLTLTQKHITATVQTAEDLLELLTHESLACVGSSVVFAVGKQRIHVIGMRGMLISDQLKGTALVCLGRRKPTSDYGPSGNQPRPMEVRAAATLNDLWSRGVVITVRAFIA